MTTEVREAAERIRKAMKTGIYLGEYGQREIDHQLLAQAYLAENDETPIDDAYLDSQFKPWQQRGWEVKSFCIIRKSEDGIGGELGYFPVFSHTGEGPSGARLKTRGSLRRLLRALGVEVRG